MPITASAVLGVGTGIAQFVGGAKDEKKAKEERDRLANPFYKIQDEYVQNQNLAKQIASQGLTSDAKNYLTTETQRGLGTSIGAINQSGGNPNDVAGLFDVYRRGINSTAAQDSEKQLENIKYLMGVNKDLAGQKTTQWAINEYQPYQNKLKELTERIGAAKQNKFGGVQTAIGSLSALGTGLQNNGLGKAGNSGQPSANPTDPLLLNQQQQKLIADPQENKVIGQLRQPNYNWEQIQNDYNQSQMPEDEMNMLLRGYFNK